MCCIFWPHETHINDWLVSNDIFKILICSVCRSFPHSWLITRFVTRVIWRVPHVVQELCSHPEHLTSPSVSSEVRVAPFLVFYVMFCRSLFYVLSFYFVCHCVFHPCSIYAFWMPLFGIIKHIFSSILCSISDKGECKSWIIYILKETSIFVKAKG